MWSLCERILFSPQSFAIIRREEPPVQQNGKVGYRSNQNGCLPRLIVLKRNKHVFLSENLLQTDR